MISQEQTTRTGVWVMVLRVSEYQKLGEDSGSIHGLFDLRGGRREETRFVDRLSCSVGSADRGRPRRQRRLSLENCSFFISCLSSIFIDSIIK